jgi:hypothetical protein
MILHTALAIPSHNAVQVKALILDDALRPQAVQAGVASVVCQAMQQWEDEIICMRELLAAAQTLVRFVYSIASAVLERVQ